MPGYFFFAVFVYEEKKQTKYVALSLMRTVDDWNTGSYEVFDLHQNPD